MNIDNTLIVGISTIIVTLIVPFISDYLSNKKNHSETYSMFNKRYTVLIRKYDNKTILVKDGFSWTAYFFNIFWLFYSRLWEIILKFLLIFVGLFLHFYLIDLVCQTHFLIYYVKFLMIFILIIPLILGMFGNRLIMRKYTHSFLLIDYRTYDVMDSVVATNKTNALLKYMEKENAN